MSEKVIVTKSKLTAIGDNIRNQTNTTKQYTLDEMAKMKLGTDTKDATATSEDILLGKTAYVNDVKVVGAIEDYDGSVENLEEIDMVKQLIVSKGSLNYMFYGSNCTNVEVENLLTANRIESVESAEYCFQNTKNLTEINMKLLNCIKYQGFARNGSLENVTLDLSKLEEKTSKIALNLNYSFGECSKLKNINLKLPKNLYKDSTINWDYTFYNNTLLDLTQEQIDDIFNIEIPGHTSYGSQCKSYKYTFKGCTGLKINNLKINIGHYYNYFYETFRGCTGLTGNAEIIKNSNYTNNTMDVYSFFQGCTGLNSIVIRSGESGLIRISNLANGCTNLTNFEFYTSDYPYSNNYFTSTLQGCVKLKTIQLDYGHFGSSSGMNSFCNNCYSVVCIKINNIKDGQYTLSSSAFSSCVHLFGTYDETYNPYALQDAYVYVPDSWVDTLKVSTNWSSFGTQIRPLSVFNTITINNVEYTCEYNQTWEQWLNSSYNTSGFTSANTFIANDLLMYCDEEQTTPTEHTTGFDFTNYLSTTIVAGGSNFTIN